NFNVAHRVGFVNVIELDHRTRFRGLRRQPDGGLEFLWLYCKRGRHRFSLSLRNLRVLCVSAVRLTAETQRTPRSRREFRYRRPPAPLVRGALPNPGGVDCVFAVLLAPEICWPVITMSPSFSSPSTTSVADPSLKPTVILRRSGLPFWPITQTTRI